MTAWEAGRGDVGEDFSFEKEKPSPNPTQREHLGKKDISIV